MAIYSRSSIQNTNNRGFSIWEKNTLLNIVNNLQDIDKIYLYAKDPYEAKYQFLTNKRKSIGLKHFNDPKVFIQYLDDMQDVYKNIDEYNIEKERKILTVFDDVIADIINNKKTEFNSNRFVY